MVSSRARALLSKGGQLICIDFKLNQLSFERLSVAALWLLLFFSFLFILVLILYHVFLLSIEIVNKIEATQLHI